MWCEEIFTYGASLPLPLSGLLLVATWILHLPAATIFTLMLLTHGTQFLLREARIHCRRLLSRRPGSDLISANCLLSLCNTSVHTYKLRGAFSCILTHIALSPSAVNRDCCELQKIHVGNPNRLLESDAYLRESIYRCFASLSLASFHDSTSHLLFRTRLFLHARRCTRARVLVEIHVAPVHSPHLYAVRKAHRSSRSFSILYLFHRFSTPLS